jgi:zinc protease
MTTALDELYGLGYTNSENEDARYAVVTPEQVRAVAQKYLRPEAAVIAIIKPQNPAVEQALVEVSAVR